MAARALEFVFRPELSEAVRVVSASVVHVPAMAARDVDACGPILPRGADGCCALCFLLGPGVEVGDNARKPALLPA